MRYIKIYEEVTNTIHKIYEDFIGLNDPVKIYNREDFKFNLGDYVWFLGGIDDSHLEKGGLYQLYMIDTDKERYYKYYIEDPQDKSFGDWVAEEEIKLAADYEIAARNYNL
jgi:hypothetical protein